MASFKPTAFAVCVSLMVGCGDNRVIEADAGVTPDPLRINWTPCVLETSLHEPAECATVAMPYRWDHREDPRTVDVAIKRLSAPGGSRGQLWFLQGGPGASGRVFDGFAELFATFHLGLDFYMIDQRGTGLSSRLGCPAQESAGSPGGYTIADSEWRTCIAAMHSAWEPGLRGFSVTNTARDLGELVAATRAPAPDAQVLIYGVSYGTYLVNRYLELYPDQPTGVILDSICGDECAFDRSDVRFNAVAHQYFDACGADSACAARLGAQPWSRLGTVLDMLDAGHCPAAAASGLDRTALRHIFSSLLYQWESRSLVPALVHRLERCSPGDVAVISRFGSLYSAPAGPASVEEMSMALANHIGLSELWDEPSPSLAQLQAAEATQFISNGVAVEMAALHDEWPRVPHDEYFGHWARTAAPILMLQGGLDPATPLAHSGGAQMAFVGPHQTFVVIPNAPHGVLVESPVEGSLPCGMTLLLGFVADPTRPVDTSCGASVTPLQFETSTYTMDYFGTSSLWGD